MVTEKGKDALQYVEKSQYFRKEATVESSFHYDFKGAGYKDTGPSSRRVSKNTEECIFENSHVLCPGGSTILIWLQNDFGYDLWTPSEARVKSVVEQFKSTSQSVLAH